VQEHFTKNMDLIGRLRNQFKKEIQ
jgi:hypothetical protein